MKLISNTWDSVYGGYRYTTIHSSEQGSIIVKQFYPAHIVVTAIDGIHASHHVYSYDELTCLPADVEYYLAHRQDTGTQRPLKSIDKLATHLYPIVK